MDLDREDLQESVRQAHKPNEVYDGDPLENLFKFYSSSLVRKLREGFLELSSHFGVNDST